MKELLSQEQVPFTAYNIEEDDRAYQELIARGFRTVPITVIGNRTIKGFNRDALLAALKAGC